ncbi:hypothetical protein [Marivirga arenosa]|uniref:Uncharacterized protein n=1 Tax=Marivirga arenosa TaxID=3059076 RepID=A0AA49GC49_9BACT|nr:hypothetical protein [Marivirga sp. BKB1-2]WKK80311.1 hypothetical protein QYS47_24575 [Marivirga sp. BKB1-2]
METKYLLKDEQIITQSDQKIITLTNQRIRYAAKALGKAHIVSMMLNKISSIELKYKNNLLLLLLAIIGALVLVYGYSMDDTDLLVAGLIGMTICVYIYIKNRKYVISIASESGKEILFHTKGMKHEDILKFINQTEEAIQNLDR